MVPFGQGFASMSGPTKDFYRLLMEGQIIYGGHPVLRWMAGNVVVDTDPAGNIKVTRAKSKKRSTVLWLRSWRLTGASEIRRSHRGVSMMIAAC